MDKTDVMSSDRSFKIIFLFNLLYNEGSFGQCMKSDSTINP